MKSIIPILLLIAYGSIQFTSAETNYRCEKLLLGTLEIKDNPFVKPGKRDNKTVWYDSVTWERIPLGQVIINCDVILHKWGKRYNSQNWGRTPFDLFTAYDSVQTDGSFANLIRMALGIPRFSDPVMGKRKVDSLLFSPEPCTVFFTNFHPYETEHQYSFDFTVTTKEGGKSYVLVKGTLIRPVE